MIKISSSCPAGVAAVETSDLRNCDGLDSALRRLDLSRFRRVFTETEVAAIFVVVRFGMPSEFAEDAVGSEV